MIKRSYSHSSNSSSTVNGKITPENVNNNYQKQIVQQFNQRQKNIQEQTSNPHYHHNNTNNNICEVNSSFVDYLMQDLDRSGHHNKLDQSQTKQDGQRESPIGVRQRREGEQLPLNQPEQKQNTPTLYNQQHQHQKLNFKDYQKGQKGEGRRVESAMGEYNNYESSNSSQQISQFMDNKKQRQNTYVNGKCVYKIFPNIQLKLPVITQQNNQNNVHSAQLQISHQNNASSYKPYQLGYSLDQHPSYQVSGQKQATKTEQSPRGYTAGVQQQNTANNYNINNNINHPTNSNTNNVKNYIDRSFEEIINRVSSDNTNVNKLNQKTEQTNSISKQIDRNNFTEASDFSLNEIFHTDNPTIKHSDLLNSKRKILLKFKPKVQSRNKTQISNGQTQSIPQTTGYFNMGEFLKSRLQQDKLMNYISCKFNQIDKNQTNLISKDEIIKFFESNNNNSTSMIQNYKELEQYVISNFNNFILELVERQTERAGLLNFREFKQLFNDFFTKSIHPATAAENKTNRSNMQNNFRNDDQSISEMQIDNKRQISSEIKNNCNISDNSSTKRIFSAQKMRNYDNDDFIANHQKDNSFHIPSQRKQFYYIKQNKGVQQTLQNILLQERQINNQSSNYKTNSNNQTSNNAQNKSRSSSNNQIIQNQNNSANQLKFNQNNSSNIQLFPSNSNNSNVLYKQKQKYQPSLNINKNVIMQIPQTNFSEQDFQSPTKVKSTRQQQQNQDSVIKQNIPSNQLLEAMQRKNVNQSEKGIENAEELEKFKKKNSACSNGDQIFTTEQKVRSQSAMRISSSHSTRKRGQNERQSHQNLVQNNQGLQKQTSKRSDSQQSNFSSESPVNKEQQSPLLKQLNMKSKFSQESPTQREQIKKIRASCEDIDSQEQPNKFVQLKQIINSDSVQQIQQQVPSNKNIPSKKGNNSENFIVKQKSTSKSLHNNQNNIEYMRNMSRESDSTRISINQSKTLEKITLEESQQVFFLKKQEQDSDHQLSAIPNTRYDQKQSNNTHAEFSKSRSDSKQLNNGQDITKSSSFTDKSIVQINEVQGNPRYYFSSQSSQQIQDEHQQFKLAFEDQKLNKILEKQKLQNQRNAFIGMSGSLLLRQYNMKFKINSPQKKNSLSLHESNQIIEQNEPTLTEPNEQSITERNENQKLSKQNSPPKSKEFECTFRPQSLERELKEIKQLNILQNDSINQSNEQGEQIQNQISQKNQLKVQSFCNSPPNNQQDTPQYQQLKMLDLNDKSKTNEGKSEISLIKQNEKTEVIAESLQENNPTSESKRSKKIKKLKQITSDEVIETEMQKEKQQQATQTQQSSNLNVEKGEQSLNQMNLNTKKQVNARKSLSDNKNLSLNLIANAESSSQKIQNKHKDLTTKSQNQIQYQENNNDDTRKSIHTKPSYGNQNFSKNQNDSQNVKSEALNSHIDQNCQNFLKKKEVKVLKKSLAKKPSTENSTKPIATFNDQIEEKEINSEVIQDNNATFSAEGKNILNDITFDNNAQSINQENKKKNSIQYEDYKQFYQNNSLSNSQSKIA